MQIRTQIGGFASTEVQILTRTCFTSTEVPILTQIGGVSVADLGWKQALVRHGFRLPSAMDNRPLTADEFWQKVGRPVLVGSPDICWRMLTYAGAC